MLYYDTDNQDQRIDFILRFLFDYQPNHIKASQYKEVIEALEGLEIAAMYQLFALIKEQLPFKAKLYFAAEDYEGKKMMILEVFVQLSNKKYV